MKKHYLMTPGPTPVPDESLLAQAAPMIHHRAPAYTKILLRVIENLKYVFRTEQDIIIFASSGTGSMESAVVNLFSKGEKVIVVSTGNFGERWVQISDAFGLEVVKLQYDWGERSNIKDIKRIFDENPDAKGMLVTHAETSTGVVNDIKAMAQLTKGKDTVLVVDSVSGLGACELKMDEWGIDVVVSGSQKALMAPPGLAFVSLSDKAWKFVEKSDLPKYYWDYKKYRLALQKASPQSPFTPAISTMLALGKSLQMIKDEGMENVWERHKFLAKAIREAAKAIGLELFAPDDDRANSVTAIKAPEGIDGQEIVKIMREKHGITIAGGQSKVMGKIFRIGHCGYYGKFDILQTVSALEMVLKELGLNINEGAGVGAAARVLKNLND